MPTSEIQAAVDAIYAQQVNNEMGSQRYALLFKPGSYGTVANPLIVKVGYYTEVAGLGRDPGDVTINGLGTGWTHEALLRHVRSRRTSDQSGDPDPWRDDGHELRG